MRAITLALFLFTLGLPDRATAQSRSAPASKDRAHCFNPEIQRCEDFGADEREMRKSMCEAVGSSFGEGPCPSANLLGTCKRSGTRFLYAGDSGLDLPFAEDDCLEGGGVWTTAGPVADALQPRSLKLERQVDAFDESAGAARFALRVPKGAEREALIGVTYRFLHPAAWFVLQADVVRRGVKSQAEAVALVEEAGASVESQRTLGPGRFLVKGKPEHGHATVWVVTANAYVRCRGPISGAAAAEAICESFEELR